MHAYTVSKNNGHNKLQAAMSSFVEVVKIHVVTMTAVSRAHMFDMAAFPAPPHS